MANTAPVTNLGGNLSLTYTAEHLEISTGSLRKGFCGIGRQKRGKTIPFTHILSAQKSEQSLIIDYLDKDKQQRWSRQVVSLDLSQSPSAGSPESHCTQILERAWGPDVERHKRILLLVNPKGGKGFASNIARDTVIPILLAAGCTVERIDTTHRGHAETIARDLDIHQYDMIVCCSGDGLPHEVFNGLGLRPDAKLALAKLAVSLMPCGSGNALCWNCFNTGDPAEASIRLLKGTRMPIDLVSVTQVDAESKQVIRKLSFLSQAVGIVAECDLGTENLRWLGPIRFDVGFLIRVLGKTVYPCHVSVLADADSKADVLARYQSHVGQIDALEPARLQAANKEYNVNEEDGKTPSAPLPDLRYGTMADPLPEGWTEVEYKNLGNFYCGNMPIMTVDAPFFPAALPADGCADLVTIDGDVSKTRALKMALGVPKYTFMGMHEVRYRKVLAYRISPDLPSGYISIDGESFPFQGFQAEVHPALGTTISNNGQRYEVPVFKGA